MSEQPILHEINDGIGRIILNRPDKFNCISASLLGAMEQVLDAFEADPAVRAIVITGAGKHFCTGADLDEVLAAREERAQLKQFIGTGHRVLRRLEMSPLPVIASVHGLALAGGLEIVLASDVVFMAKSAKLGDQHAQFGLVPGFGGSQRLPRIVGRRRAIELMFSARWLSSDEAADWGLANFVVEDDALEADALAYAGQAAKRSPEGLALMKRLAREGLDDHLAAGLKLEETLAVDGLLSDNVAEGLAAFQERREPVFK